MLSGYIREKIKTERQFPWAIKINLKRGSVRYLEYCMSRAGWCLNHTFVVMTLHNAMNHVRVAIRFRSRRALITFLDEFYAIICYAGKQIIA